MHRAIHLLDRLGRNTFLSIVLGLALSGCAAPVLIGVGAVGGYAISRDSVTDYFDLPQRHVYDKALRVLEDMGKVSVKDSEHGLIKALVDDVHVTLTVTPLTDQTVRLKIKARDKFYLPKVSVAQDVYAVLSKELQ